jgi:hypothetical protein
MNTDTISTGIVAVDYSKSLQNMMGDGSYDWVNPAEGGGVHFKGASSTGKSTALHVAGSVWGGGDTNGYIRSWRSTITTR